MITVDLQSKKLLPVRTGLVAKSITSPEMFRYSTAASCTCALLTIWLQRMFENGNIIPVYSPLVDRLGLGPCLVGRIGFSSTG